MALPPENPATPLKRGCFETAAFENKPTAEYAAILHSVLMLVCKQAPGQTESSAALAAAELFCVQISDGLAGAAGKPGGTFTINSHVRLSKMLYLQCVNGLNLEITRKRGVGYGFRCVVPDVSDLPRFFAKESPAVSKAAKACIAVPPNALPPKDRYAALSGVCSNTRREMSSLRRSEARSFLLCTVSAQVLPLSVRSSVDENRRNPLFLCRNGYGFGLTHKGRTEP